MRLGREFWLIGCGALGVAIACSSTNASDKASGASDNFGATADSGAFFGGPGIGNGAGATSGAGGAAALPPEKEVDVGFELPHAGAHFVYVANPDSNNIAVIDARTLAIQTVEAGAGPRFLQTFGTDDAAIVLNTVSSDATIVRTDAASGTSTVARVPVERGSNAIAVAPDGQHAIVYYNDAFSSPTTTPGSFQHVTVVKLEAGADASTGMSIGYRASRVFFTTDSTNNTTKAFIITEDGVNVLDLAAIDQNGPSIADIVDYGSPGLGKAPDVSVTPDGLYALAREPAGSALRLIELSTVKRTVRRLDLANVGGTATGTDAGGHDAGAANSDSGGAPPPPGQVTVTDVDLEPNGTYAMAVLRERSGVVRIPIPGGFDGTSLATLTSVPGELIGSVTLTPKGKYALLFTTAEPTNERMTILALDGKSEPRSIQLRKSIASIVVAPDEATALIVHQKLPGDPNEPGLDEETKVDRQDGYSVVALDRGFPVLQITDAPLGPSTIVPDGSNLFILFNAPSLREVQSVDLRSFLVSHIALGSPPVSVGSVPTTNRVFVGQDHPDGRISFIDWTTGAVQSVTGFELNSRIRE
jgi:YVTN family beta-propeller protein